MEHEWNSGPLPEGGEGGRIELGGLGTAYWYKRAWHMFEDFVEVLSRYVPGADFDGGWRWLQRPGELEELRARVSSPGRFASMERIVGEVERVMLDPMTADPADCVTLHGQWAAWMADDTGDDGPGQCAQEVADELRRRL